MQMRWDLLQLEVVSSDKLVARLASPSTSDDIFIAQDLRRLRHLLIRLPDDSKTELTVRPSRGIFIQAIDLKLGSSPSVKRFLEITCQESAGWPALDMVALEIIQAVSLGQQLDRILLVQNVLAKWQRFWGSAGSVVLTRDQQIGLFGELVFLTRWLLPTLGPQLAVEMWRGPTGARRDFETKDMGFEVKTTARMDEVVHIHGLEQLWVLPPAKLYLFGIVVTDDAVTGETLNDIIEETLAIIGEDWTVRSKFESMLAAADYDERDLVHYQKLRLRIRHSRLYEVAEQFPKVTPDTLFQGLPIGVMNVSYELSLASAHQFVVARTPADVGILLQEKCSGYA